MSKETPHVQSTAPGAMLDTTTPMERFLEAHFKKLVLLFVIIALGAVAYGVIRYSNHTSEVAAGEAFVAARTVEDYDRVISEHAGTEAAGNALILKASQLWAENKKDSSVEALRTFTNSYKSHPLYAENLLSLASKLDAMGETAQARPLYEKVIAENAGKDVAAVAQIRLGDLLWKEGKADEAKATYEAVPAKYASAHKDILDRSDTRLKWIAAKLPENEVDGPPKPKEEKPATPLPGAPQLNLNSTTLQPTLMPEGEAPVPASSPTPPPAEPVQTNPAAPASAPQTAPQSSEAAPMTEKKEAEPSSSEVPVPAPTPVPMVEPPATTTPANSPAAPESAPVTVPPPVEVNPAPPAPAAPIPPPVPAPVPAPAPTQPDAPAPEAPAQPS